MYMTIQVFYVRSLVVGDPNLGSYNKAFCIRDKTWAQGGKEELPRGASRDTAYHRAHISHSLSISSTLSFHISQKQPHLNSG